MKSRTVFNAAASAITTCVNPMSDDCPFVCLFDRNSGSNGEEVPWMFSGRGDNQLLQAVKYIENLK